ncbi:MAG: tetratricopeptide repeat protein [Methanomassiliicoccales archaeon]|nr:MAG: tetratricopeptide repeat protein [Methanomassiliicoccales archaeon]
MRSILFKLAELLSKLGHDHLEIYLRTRTSLDYYELSRILEKSIGVKDVVLVFDDFHKANNQIRTFFVNIVRMLSLSTKTKMLILSREIVSFDDWWDLHAREIVAELELEGLDFESSKKLLKGKNIDKRTFKEMYRLTAGIPLFLEIFQSKGRFERYMHDELLSKLDEDERKILEIISIFRYPVPEDFLALYDELDFEKLYILRQKSIVKKDARERYFVHDIVKQFFYKRLSPSRRKKHHLIAASGYEIKDEPLDIIEAIYHYQEAGEYKKASQLAIDRSAYIFDGGSAAEFLVILERFDEKVVDTKLWASLLMVKAKACNMIGEWKRSLLYLTLCEDIASFIGDNELEVNVICESGRILEELNELEKAMDRFKKGLKLSKKSDFLLGMGESYKGIGRVHWRKSKHKEAINHLKKSVEIFEGTGTRELIAATYIDLGNVFDESYKIEKAIECYNKSLDILKEVKDSQETARAYGNLGIAYKRQGEFEKAIEFITKEMTLAKASRDVKLLGYSTAGLSYCFAKIGEIEKAREYVEKAGEIASKIDNENIMFDVYKTRSLICKHEKNWDRAVKYFKKSIEIVEKLDALYYLSDSYFEFGLLYEGMGNTKTAKKYFDKASKLYDKLGIRKTHS